MKATYQKYILDFKRPSGTSRGILTQKETWFIILENEGKRGVGECGILRTLSSDDRPDFEEKLKWVCQNIHIGPQELWKNLLEFPSIQCGVEMAFLSLESHHPFELFPSEFTSGKESMEINGLVWMGEESYMKAQIEEKLKQGFRCVKLKIGAIDFEKELGLLQFIRQHFDEHSIEIRVDANGAFHPKEAIEKLNQLATYNIHSIEQPIAKNQLESMVELCEKTPIPIVLDEELIGVFSIENKLKLLERVKPHYIVLKPSLVGGFTGANEWINFADELQIGWWITSALESNIGLNAIAQWTFTLQNPMPQGLGTGGLYTNNIGCPLEIYNGRIQYNPSISWDTKAINF
ncbi:MAG: o-succinylbenzoate synthase [Flavobacterium sp.]|nr:o-succinylbenzoate synthase [Flavobacterium sp.]